MIISLLAGTGTISRFRSAFSVQLPQRAYNPLGLHFITEVSMQDVKGLLGYFAERYPVDFVVTGSVIVVYYDRTEYVGSWPNNSRGKADCIARVKEVCKQYNDLGL